MAITARTTSRSTGAFIRVFAALGPALAVMLGVAAASQPAAARPVCVAHADLAKHLGGKFAEKPVAMGLASDGTLMQVFASKDGATWTLVRAMPDGNSCVMAGGEGWTEVPISAAGRVS
jgi:hypothetical protein